MDGDALKKLRSILTLRYPESEAALDALVAEVEQLRAQLRESQDATLSYRMRVGTVAYAESLTDQIERLRAERDAAVRMRDSADSAFFDVSSEATALRAEKQQLEERLKRYIDIADQRLRQGVRHREHIQRLQEALREIADNAESWRGTPSGYTEHNFRAFTSAISAIGRRAHAALTATDPTRGTAVKIAWFQGDAQKPEDEPEDYRDYRCQDDIMEFAETKHSRTPLLRVLLVPDDTDLRTLGGDDWNDAPADCNASEPYHPPEGSVWLNLRLGDLWTDPPEA